ncbi:MAG: GAF domain-containing protein [Peptostreptococcaceae bacterium]|nr:GAF domain-containing protein [Peptostreptococcaceae bacterium]
MSIKIIGIEKMTKAQRLNYMNMLLGGQLDTEDDWIANLSNASAIIKSVIEDLNWAGFYLEKNGELVLGPFQGLPACNRIRSGKGVCGTAMEKHSTMLVENVEEFEGHIACDSASRSELVVPMIANGKVIGVLDLDSPLLSRFGEEEKEAFEKFVDILMKKYCTLK